MKDGLYRVVTHFCVAGFVIRDGKLAECAPVLQRQFSRFWPHAVWICS